MAPRKKVNDFYREKKKVAVTRKPAVSKKSQTTEKTKKKKSGLELIEDDVDFVDAMETTMREFDVDMKYGPCTGITRLERWERANKFGLNPPKDLESWLKSGLVDIHHCWNSKI